MKYACLNKQEFVDNSYRLVPLREQDIFLIKQWRNEQIDVLRQNVHLTDDMQRSYYDNIIQPSFEMKQPNQILFSFLLDNHLIGYGGIVHIDWKEKQGEVSFLVDTKRTKNLSQYEKDFAAFLKLIKSIAFQELQWNRLYTETYDIRTHHISILEKAGFTEEKRLKNWIQIQGKHVDAIIHGCSL